jgi:ribosomal protein S18 acetylase RimI-like enzyme
MEVSVQLLDHHAAGPYEAGVLDVWVQAFGPVDDVRGWTGATWNRHRSRADYRLAVAEEGRRVVGFAWGYTGQPGQYWPDLVSTTLGAAVDGWVGGHFEFVELAVAPGARRRGLGGRLHDALVAGLPHDRGLLGTSADPADPAVALYLGRGWQPLGHLSSSTQVMGIHRPARAVATSSRPPLVRGRTQPPTGV